MSFKAWKSIKIGISGGRARSAVSLMDSDFASSVTCSLQSKRRKSDLGFVAVFLDGRIKKIMTEKNKIFKEMLRKLMKVCLNHLYKNLVKLKIIWHQIQSLNMGLMMLTVSAKLMLNPEH